MKLRRSLFPSGAWIPKPEKNAESDERETDPLGNGKNAIDTADCVVAEEFEHETDDSVAGQIECENLARRPFFSSIAKHKKKQGQQACRFDQLNGQEPYAVRRKGRSVEIDAEAAGKPIAAPGGKAADAPYGVHQRDRGQYGVDHSPYRRTNKLCGHEYKQDRAGKTTVIDKARIPEIFENRIARFSRQLQKLWEALDHIEQFAAEKRAGCRNK